MMIANRLGPDNYATELERQASLYVQDRALSQ
jgi:hypothetical protein